MTKAPKRKASEKTRWEEFLEFCNNHGQTNWWFRGVRDNSYKLVPKIGRDLVGEDWNSPIDKKNKTTHAQREKRIFEAFRRRARLELRFLPNSEFEWLALAQHHGVPTRLLDWTPNPLMAAWFATSKLEARKSESALIYAVRVTSKVAIGDATPPDPFSEEQAEPLFVVSPHWHPRVRAQRGCFSIHPIPNKPWELSAHTFTIRQEDWRDFRRRLFYFGVDASTVMADLGGLGQALAWQYRERIGIGAIGY